MQEYIFILFSEMEDSAHYIVMNESGEKIASSEQEDNLKNISYLCVNRQVIILIPGKYVSFYKVTLPYGTRDKLQSSLPYILEEEISEDIDNLQFVLGPKIAESEPSINESDNLDLEDETKELLEDAEKIAIENDSKEVEKPQNKVSSILNKSLKKSTKYLVAVLSLEIMDYYFKLLKKNHIKPDYLLSDNFCLKDDSSDQLYINGLENQVYYLNKDNDIYNLDLENLSLFQDKLFSNKKQKTEIYQYRVDQKIDILPQSDLINVDSEVELFAMKWLTQRSKINFLTGKYKIFKVQLKNKLLWKSALGLIVFILLADFGISVTKYILVENQVAKIDKQITKEWRKIFPAKTGVKVPTNLSEATTLVSREINTAEKQQVQNNFFSALNVLGQTLNQYSNIQLENISFLESQLKIKLKVPNIIILNNFEKAFKSKDKSIKRISLKEEKGAIVAGFMIKVG